MLEREVPLRRAAAHHLHPGITSTRPTPGRLFIHASVPVVRVRALDAVGSHRGRPHRPAGRRRVHRPLRHDDIGLPARSFSSFTEAARGPRLPVSPAASTTRSTTRKRLKAGVCIGRKVIEQIAGALIRYSTTPPVKGAAGSPPCVGTHRAESRGSAPPPRGGAPSGPPLRVLRGPLARGRETAVVPRLGGAEPSVEPSERGVLALLEQDKNARTT